MGHQVKCRLRWLGFESDNFYYNWIMHHIWPGYGPKLVAGLSHGSTWLGQPILIQNPHPCSYRSRTSIHCTSSEHNLVPHIIASTLGCFSGGELRTFFFKIISMLFLFHSKYHETKNIKNKIGYCQETEPSNRIEEGGVWHRNGELSLLMCYGSCCIEQ